MEEDSSDEDDVSPPGDTHKSKDSKSRETNMQPPPLPPTPGNVVVKKGYDPKQHGKYSGQSTVIGLSVDNITRLYP